MDGCNGRISRSCCKVCFKADALIDSVKWVGLFAIALVGLVFFCSLIAISTLFKSYGKCLEISKCPLYAFQSVPKLKLQRVYMRHWFARIIALILVPVSLYILSFVIHFRILNHSGEGDATMSSLFQANLVGIDFSSNPLGLFQVYSLKNRTGIRIHRDHQKLCARGCSFAFSRPTISRWFWATTSDCVSTQG